MLGGPTIILISSACSIVAFGGLCLALNAMHRKSKTDAALRRQHRANHARGSRFGACPEYDAEQRTKHRLLAEIEAAAKAADNRKQILLRDEMDAIFQAADRGWTYEPILTRTSEEHHPENF